MSDLSKQYVVSRSRLEGVVTISGAKNSVLKLLTASILTSGNVKLDNFPDTIEDGKIHVDMLRVLGKTCTVSPGSAVINEPDGLSTSLHWEGRSIRNTLLMLGALVARFGEGAVPLPAGCNLGGRGIDLHEMLLREMGADIWVEDGVLCAEAKNRLKGKDIRLPIRSTGATENAIICGTLAQGTTRVWNPHIRPEVLDLIGFLKEMGAVIRVYGQQCIEIDGVDSLGDVCYSVLPDNMEAITWLVGSVITGGDVEIENFPFAHLEVPLIFLRESGAKFFRGEDRLIVRGGTCYPIEISTGPYPGINSDMQPIFGVYGLCAKGKSHIVDLRFPGRYQYAAELAKMGAKVEEVNNLLILEGGVPLVGAEVMATDLRAGIALALAGLVADGETVINDGFQIDRGYDRFESKLKALGGTVKRVV
ncbi:UDP-N-acetylglucosamine 1-carboxyvinyltransferase [hydrothermal vent metagenome]|uniref:UDP-N-acetylglucosamine 1-carboxyvinyltransferase n=1 Tax=hydrothermal vent metagenome TaxID=652676 RepID=A0A3B0YNY3_9ZZZZ